MSEIEEVSGENPFVAKVEFGQAKGKGDFRLEGLYSVPY
jgi:hypothetical protein